MTPDDQTSLRSSLCPTSDFTCGAIMFIMVSEEKKILWKKQKQQQQNNLILSILCMYLAVQ